MRYKVAVDAELEAGTVSEAARKMAAHLVAVAEAWDAGEADWDRIPSTSTAPTTLDIRPVWPI
jgi:hypothetical protein